MHNLVTFSGGDRWDAIIAELGERRVLLAQRFLARVAQIEDYTANLVAEDDVRETAMESMRLLTESMAEGHAGTELIDFATSLGAKRARQGVPAESLITAVRLDFSILWSDLLEICGPDDASLLAARVERVWQVVDEYATKTHASYHDERIRMAQEESSFKREFIARLFGPTGQSLDVLAKAAAGLEVDLDGEFSVAAATGDGAEALRAEATSGIRSKGHFFHQSGSVTYLFWQTGRGGQGAPTVIPAPPALASVPCGIVHGIRSLRAVAAGAATASALAQLLTADDEGPLTMDRGWARLAREEMREAGLDLAGEIELALSGCKPVERQRLEAAVRVFVQSGSVSGTADALFHHRNTILNRLRRFQELTGIDLMVPAQAARLVVAWS